MELGKLEYMNPRKKWEKEAQDFTPWLADNLEELSNALNMELEFEKKEASVGPYFADILAKDDENRYVVIENQIGKTDHDHLGKSITYASVLDAKTIIWIATEFTDEHKKALEWLNDLTDDETSFYGVKLELWKIDNSKPALKLDIVCQPNETVRETRSMAKRDLSDTEKFQLEFWRDFREKLTKINKISSLRKPNPQLWFDISIGKSHVHIDNRCSLQKKEVSTRIYIHGKIADEMLPFLENKKDEIEKKIGSKLTWNPYPEKQDKVISLSFKTNITNSEDREKALNWLVEHAVKFYEVFSPIVKEF